MHAVGSSLVEREFSIDHRTAQVTTMDEYNKVNSRKVQVELGDLAAFHIAIATADDYLQWLVNIRCERHGAVETPMKLAHAARKIISRIMQDVDNTLAIEESAPQRRGGSHG